MAAAASIASPAKAQLLNLSANANLAVPAILAPAIVTVPVQVLGNTVNVSLSVSASERGITLLPLNGTLAITVGGQTISAAIQPSALPIVGELPTVTVPIIITLPADVLAGVLNTLGAAVAVRRNDALLSLDLGLDRQVEILANPGANDDGVWSQPMGLGAMRLGGTPIDNPESAPGRRGGSDALGGDQASFATSLQKMRQANAAYAPPAGLGATSRPPVPAANAPFDIWAEGTLAWFADGNGTAERHGRWGVLYLGADYRIARDMLVGTLVQFDGSSQEFDTFASSQRSNGWMVGPYATMRLTSHLFFQARAAWGRSTAELGLGNDPADEVNAERWLARGTLLGQWRSGPWQLRPRISVGYIEERQDGYLSSLGAAVPGQTLSLGQAKGGPELAYRTVLRDGTVIEPKLLLEGVWNFFRDGGAITPEDLVFGERLRGRVETGIDVLLRAGAAFSASVSYDGIGAGDYHAVATKLRAKISLN